MLNYFGKIKGNSCFEIGLFIAAEIADCDKANVGFFVYFTAI